MTEYYYPPFPLIPELEFSPAVPAGQPCMPPQSITGPLAFSIAQDLSFGSTCTVDLTADGTHVPTFPGFTQASFSLPWNDTAGLVHTVSLAYGPQDSGPSYAIGPIASSAIPAVTSLAVTHGQNPTVAIATGGSSLNTAYVPDATLFSIQRLQTLLNASILGVTSVAVTANQIALTLSGAISLGDTVTLSYTPPPGRPAYPVVAQDGSGNSLAGFTGTVTVS